MSEHETRGTGSAPLFLLVMVRSELEEDVVQEMTDYLAECGNGSRPGPALPRRRVGFFVYFSRRPRHVRECCWEVRGYSP